MPRKREDLTGRQFGRLTVLSFSHMDKHGESFWSCECSCSDRKVIVVPRSNLIRGHTTSCGCKLHERDKNDLTGNKFGRLTVLSYDHSDYNYVTHWLCQCECGNVVVVSRTSLLNGSTVSCGCYSKEMCGKRFATHGGSKTSLYDIWHGMRQRCENESNRAYGRYGARGIKVCDEWKSFENFRDWALDNGYDPNLSIDRRNNNDGYYPENCRWADKITQQNNRGVNHNITYGDVTRTLANWSRILGVNYNTLWGRVNRGDMHDFDKYFSKND